MNVKNEESDVRASKGMTMTCCKSMAVVELLVEFWWVSLKFEKESESDR